MKRPPILVVADCHIGNTGPFPGPMISGINARCRQALGALAEVSSVAKRRGARDAISLGDFFDSHRPEPAVIAAAQIALRRSGLRWHMLVGNHEQRSKREPGDNSLAPLAPVVETIVDGAPRAVPLKDLGVVLVVGSTSEEILGAIGSNPDRGPWYAFHAGIWDASHPPYMRENAVSFEAIRKLGIHALAGDWHEHAVFGAGAAKRAHRLGRIGNGYAVQVGSLLPQGFGELGPERGVALLLLDEDEEQIEVIRAPGPRFIRIQLEELAEVVRMVSAWGVYVEVEASTIEERDEAAARLAAVALAHPTRILGWRVRTTARVDGGAVARVRRGETAEAAIESFVRASPEITAPRDEVLAHALARYRQRRG